MNNVNFDPVLLRAFVAVTETGGFTRAGERLHVTQSAVSHQVRRLEEMVGRPLFRRTTRSLTLTEDGADFLRHATQILHLIDSLAVRFRPPAVSGIVRFGVPESFMGERLPPMLAEFSRSFPGVRLDVTVSTYLDLHTMIEAGDLDLAVVMSVPGLEPDALRETTVLRRAQFVWVASETFALRRGSSLPLAFSPAPCINRRVGIEALETTSIPWHIAFTSASEQGLRAAVLAGLAVAVQTQGEAGPGMSVVDGTLGLPPLPQADFTMIWSAGGKTDAARAFGKLLTRLPRGAAPSLWPHDDGR